MSASNEILDEIAYLERFENIDVLFAVEAGSRAWGFDSPDSDYDVRFVYKRRIPDYLRLDGRSDTVDWKNGDMDMSGWDLDKFLRLVRGSNPSAFEWLGSPIIYRENAHWDLVRKLSDKCFDPVSAAHHHVGMARSNMKAHFKGDSVPAKRYLYVIRSIFAGTYALRHFKQIPVPFSELYQDQYWQLDSDISNAIDGLLEQKRSNRENGVQTRNDGLEEWIEDSLRDIEVKARGYRHREKPPWSEFDLIFLKFLGILSV